MPHWTDSTKFSYSEKVALGNLIKQKESLLALGLTLAFLGLHLVVIGQPAELMFDEVHYVKEARSILAGGGLLHPEHPSLGKLFICAGIRLFGDNPFGWRIFSVLFGVASILLFYLLCRRLAPKGAIPLLATFAFSFENLNFVQSSIAMLDVYSLTFMLASFWLYLRRNYLAAGLLLALSASAKLPGAFGALVIGAHFLLSRGKSEGYSGGIKFLLSAPLSFLALMPLFDLLATGQLLPPWERVRSMLSTSLSLTLETTTHGAISRPWEWIVIPRWVTYWCHPRYLAAISWNLWVFIIPLMGYMSYRLRRDNLCLFSLLWFAGTYLIWIPLELITHRIMFLFYFYPTIGALCLAAGLCLGGLWKLRWGRPLAVVWMLSHLAAFLLLGPLL